LIPFNLLIVSAVSIKSVEVVVVRTSHLVLTWLAVSLTFWLSKRSHSSNVTIDRAITGAWRASAIEFGPVFFEFPLKS